LKLAASDTQACIQCSVGQGLVPGFHDLPQGLDGALIADLSQDLDHQALVGGVCHPIQRPKHILFGRAADLGDDSRQDDSALSAGKGQLSNEVVQDKSPYLDQNPGSLALPARVIQVIDQLFHVQGIEHAAPPAFSGACWVTTLSGYSNRNGSYRAIGA
jgi:hypothetical protein